MPGAMTACREAPPPVLARFEKALAELPDGYFGGNFSGPWGVTVNRSEDCKRTRLYGEELGGTDIASFNLYRLAGSGSILKPCEMSSEVIEFVLGFEPSRGSGASLMVAKK